MKIEAERRLWDGVLAGETAAPRAFARDIIHDMIEDGTISSGKQAHATIEKWISGGLYDFGTSLDLGWIKPGAKFPRSPA